MELNGVTFLVIVEPHRRVCAVVKFRFSHESIDDHVSVHQWCLLHFDSVPYQGDDSGVPVGLGYLKRSCTLLILKIDVTECYKEQLRDERVSLLGLPVKCRHAILW